MVSIIEVIKHLHDSVISVNIFTSLKKGKETFWIQLLLRSQSNDYEYVGKLAYLTTISISRLQSIIEQEQIRLDQGESYSESRFIMNTSDSYNILATHMTLSKNQRIDTIDKTFSYKLVGENWIPQKNSPPIATDNSLLEKY